MDPRTIAGVHAVNCKFADVEATQHPWQRIRESQASQIKLLYHPTAITHTRADAEWCHRLGLTVTVRVLQDDERMPDPGRVAAAVVEFAGLATWLEVNNEPPFPTDLARWQHALRLEEIWRDLSPPAHQAGMRLVTGGWRGDDVPPAAGPPGKHMERVDWRLNQVYRLYDAVGVHWYDAGNLTNPAPQSHLDGWRAAFPTQPMLITEAGIAARWPLGRQSGHTQAEHDAEKARRYAVAVWGLVARPYVQAAHLFICGGTRDFEAFQGGGYDPNGENRYHLETPAWRTLGDYLTCGVSTAGPTGEPGGKVTPAPHS